MVNFQKLAIRALCLLAVGIHCSFGLSQQKSQIPRVGNASFKSYLERDFDFDSTRVQAFESFSDYTRGFISQHSKLLDFAGDDFDAVENWIVGTNDGALFVPEWPEMPGIESITASNAGGFMIWQIEQARPGDALDLLQQLARAGRIDFFVPVTQTYTTNSAPNDPLYPLQWHLSDPEGFDVNVESVWDDFTGAGNTIGIIDEGVEVNHEDLSANINASSSWDFVDNDNDPTSVVAHGTSVAGLVAARQNNSIGISGVAPRARIAGLRTDLTFVQLGPALGFQQQSIDVYNNSWGPDLTGSPAFPVTANPLIMDAIQIGAESGRLGLGNIYVFSAGNDRAKGQLTNYNPEASSRFSIAVAAIGEDGIYAPFSNRGTTNLVTAPGGFQSIVTTSLSDNYTQTFGGTSAAAPIVAGVVALILEVNPSLTWLDVQSILVQSSDVVDQQNSSWQENGAGHLYNPDYGFGLVNAQAAVDLAADWVSQGEENSFVETIIVFGDFIGNGSTYTNTFSVPPSDVLEIESVKSVEIRVNITHSRREDLEISIESPSGTISTLAEARSVTSESDNYGNYLFTTVENWDEYAEGDWTLKIVDTDAGDDVNGTINSWELRIHGTEDGDDQVSEAAAFGEGMLVSDSISQSRDVDVFALNAFAGQQFNIGVTPDSALSPQLSLFDSSGTQMAQDGSSLSFQVGAVGTYYLAVHSDSNSTFDILTGTGDSGPGNSNRGDYVIEFIDNNDTLAMATAVAIDSEQDHYLSSGLDVDIFEFTAAAGDSLGFDIDLLNNNGDTILSLFDSSGNLLAQNDDFGSLASSLVHTFASSGIFYIGVSHFGDFTFDPISGASNSPLIADEPVLYRLAVETVKNTDVGDLGFGIAVDDNAIGTGYIMYSEERVHDRFNVNPDNADHFIAVRFVASQWEYNTDSGWQSFSPETNDVLVADVDFSNNEALMLAGQNVTINGIVSGFYGGDIFVVPEFWAGQADAGEFTLFGTGFDRNMVCEAIVPPDTFTRFRGVQLGGGLADLAASDDQTVSFNPGFVLNSTEAPVWLIFDGTVSSTATELSSSIESRANTPGLTLTMEFWNWNTNQYEVVETESESFNTDTVTTADLTSQISDVVEPNTGDVRSRVGWRQTGFTLLFPWRIDVDHVFWNVFG